MIDPMAVSGTMPSLGTAGTQTASPPPTVASVASASTGLKSSAGTDVVFMGNGRNFMGVTYDKVRSLRRLYLRNIGSFPIAEAAIVNIWVRLLNTLKRDVLNSNQETDDINVEHAQLLLFLFHTLPLMQKKSLLLQLAQVLNIACSLRRVMEGLFS